jgi:hypothetical protein
MVVKLSALRAGRSHFTLQEYFWYSFLIEDDQLKIVFFKSTIVILIYIYIYIYIYVNFRFCYLLHITLGRTAQQKTVGHTDISIYIFHES